MLYPSHTYARFIFIATGQITQKKKTSYTQQQQNKTITKYHILY